MADRARRRPPSCCHALQSLYGDGVSGEQHEFCAYGLLLAAAAGRSGLAHELSDALSASGSGLGAAIAAGGGSSGWGSGKSKPGKPGTPGSGSSGGGSSPGAAAEHEYQGGAAATAGAAAVADDRYVGHALAVCRAYLGNDFVRFLRLYDGAPRMAPYLMDALLAKMRGKAYSELAGEDRLGGVWRRAGGLWSLASPRGGAGQNARHST